MRKILIALAVLVGLTAPLALSATPAQAASPTPQCVTKAEWRKIKDGMYRNEVARLLGTPGKLDRSSTIEDAEGGTDIAVDYRQCTGSGKPSTDRCDTIRVGYANYTIDGDTGDTIVTGSWTSWWKSDWYPVNYNIYCSI